MYDSDLCSNTAPEELASPLTMAQATAPPFEDDDVDVEAGDAPASFPYPASEPESCSSLTPMSGMFLTRSRRKSNRLSEMMHCFMCDGERVFALRAFVMRSVLVRSDSTNSSRVRGIAAS